MACSDQLSTQDLENAKKYVQDIYTFEYSNELSFVDFDGVTRQTAKGLESKYIMTAINGGVWASGQIFTAYNQYMNLSGTSYKPKVATTLPYTIGATPDLGSVEPVTAQSADEITTTNGRTTQETIDAMQPDNDKPFVILCSGQSNAAGSNSGGPNPANTKVKTWDETLGQWGGSDYTLAPWSYSSPNGNSSNNNMALALAHRVQAVTGRDVYIIFDAVGGTSIDEWVGSGVTSTRYQAIRDKVSAAFATAELSSVTTVDCIHWQQGEEDYDNTFSEYLTKFTTLISQFRAETWTLDVTPIVCGAASELHDRYEPNRAQRHYCNKSDSFCVWVNSAGLETFGDNTHFSGDSLWEMGYYRLYQAFKQAPQLTDNEQSLFYGRGTGVASPEDPNVIASFSSIVSFDSKTVEHPVNSNAATGSITWGFECDADGNYTLAGGYQTTTDNLCNYSLVWGRSVVADSTSDYGVGGGYQNTLSNTYQSVFGRGNTVADSGGNARGTFSKYTTVEADPVIDQVGIGTSSSNRKNGLAVRESGIVEMDNLPVHANDSAAGSGGLTQGQLYITATGEIRGKV